MATASDVPLDSRYITVTSPQRSDRIHVLTGGPEPAPGTPPVVVLHGLGSACLGYATVLRQLAAAGVRAYAYDRAGSGRSVSSYPTAATSGEGEGEGEAAGEAAAPAIAPRHAPELAADVHAVLAAIGLTPPYVLVAHSYGAILAREFLGAHPEAVAGMVLIDANCQHAADRPVQERDLLVLIEAGQVDIWKETGLDERHRLEPAEWAEVTYRADVPAPFERGKDGPPAEVAGYEASCRGLQRLPQYETHPLGRRPVSVVKGCPHNDVRLLLDLADAREAGDPAFRAELRGKLVGLDDNEMRLQRDQLQLAEPGCGRLVESKGAGHNVHFTDPEMVVGEIKWVLEQAQARIREDGGGGGAEKAAVAAAAVTTA